MKTKAMYLTMVVALLSFGSLFGQTKTVKFKVYGNCGMCEKRIEKAANSVDGVSSADWDKKTKMFEASFDPAKTNIDEVHNAIAKVGHDTDKKNAKDETYDALPSCCHYERPYTKKNESSSHKH